MKERSHRTRDLNRAREEERREVVRVCGFAIIQTLYHRPSIQTQPHDTLLFISPLTHSNQSQSHSTHTSAPLSCARISFSLSACLVVLFFQVQDLLALLFKRNFSWGACGQCHKVGRVTVSSQATVRLCHAAHTRGTYRHRCGETRALSSCW